MNKIAITTGDPNGIGAEITLKALSKLNLPADKVVLISNRKVLDFYYQKFCHSELVSESSEFLSNYELIEIPFNAEIEPGRVCAEAGEFSFQSVKKACEIGAKAIVTAPVAKNALYLAGHKFSGQTEILQKYLAHDGQLAEMLFVAGGFRVLLLTRHVALKDINLTREMVVEKVSNLRDFFVSHLGIKDPKFALCAFNPHAGEDGILGREEIEILQPAVDELRTKGINITNPLPADTLFVKAANEYMLNNPRPLRGATHVDNFDGVEQEFPRPLREREELLDERSEFSNSGEGYNKREYDCYIANYHDQGLIPIKTVAGDKTVNMTIGLDIIRTSPGHGTAFDIAGKNIADETGMVEAIKAVCSKFR